ncbi:HNH endonuclease [Brevibacillus agri]|uniref:HNH endonuclease n=1 Tax=Brevibacillus TaxID=55080 RepID=UPI001EE57699|nr:HNH endonuclease signature motif containing protein [Brevibacillus agri]MCG5254823.1 HNH endonuclease [Brevibacillus agri]
MIESCLFDSLASVCSGRLSKFDWDDVDIHHIIPLAYGGDNSFDNLIQLPKNFHRREVTPWWASYGKYVPTGDDY